MAGGAVEGALDKILGVIADVRESEVIVAGLHALEYMLEDFNRVFDIITALTNIIRGRTKKDILRIAIPILESILLKYPQFIPNFIQTDCFSAVLELFDSFNSHKVEMGLAILRIICEKSNLVSSFLDENL